MVITRITREDSALVVVDVQENIIHTIAKKTQVLASMRAIIQASTVLKVPIIVTEQENLGKIISEIANLLNGDVPRVRKIAFSCWSNSVFKRKLRAKRRKIVLVCGIETHICVLQTVLSLLESGFRVVVLEDGASSHDRHDHESAVKRICDAGAIVTTTETAIYELTEQAAIQEFKQILAIVKELRRKRILEADGD